MDDERLSLTRSLEIDVHTGFGNPARNGTLSGSALVEALAGISTQPQGSLERALSGVSREAVDAEASALLAWVDATFDNWFAQYPIDSEIQNSLQAMRPLAAAFACEEKRFFTPGAHALHRLLDTLHAGFTGWSGDLGKTARPALEAVDEAIQRCLQDFPSEPAVDHTLHLLEQKIGAHREQLERLDEGLVEREQLAAGGTLTRRIIGQTLAQILGEHEVPSTLAALIGGDWFEAASDVIQNTGVGSELWQRYVSVTTSLVDPFIDPSARDSRADPASVAPNQLPGEIKAILQQVGFSDDRAQSASSTAEYLLLRQTSGQDTGPRESVTLDGQPASVWRAITAEQLSEKGIEPGEWYHIQQPEGFRRLRLAGTLAENTYLIFMDFTGASALRLSTDELMTMLHSGEAQKLDAHQTFSRALVESVEEHTAVRAQKAAEQAATEKSLAEEAAQQAAQRARERDEAARRLSDAETRSAEMSQTLAPTEAQAGNQTTSAEQPFDRKTVLQLRIPIGTWLGFHDREPPIMAKVAVRDLENDSYIFSNRDGIKLRELTVPQLVTLIERDMVDILEHRTSFKQTLATTAGAERLGQLQ